MREKGQAANYIIVVLVAVCDATGSHGNASVRWCLLKFIKYEYSDVKTTTHPLFVSIFSKFLAAKVQKVSLLVVDHKTIASY